MCWDTKYLLSYVLCSRQWKVEVILKSLDTSIKPLANSGLIPSPLEVGNPSTLVWRWSASFLFDFDTKAIEALSSFIKDKVRDTLAIPLTLNRLGLIDAHTSTAYCSTVE